MTELEFDTLLHEAGFGEDRYPPNGRLNHWPSGKLFTPMSYYEIKWLVEKILECRPIGSGCPPGEGPHYQ